MPVTMYFTGNEVAYFQGINDVNGATASEFTGVTTPFEPTDIVQITVTDASVQSNGEFSTSNIIITSITVTRDGTTYALNVDSGDKIKETGGGNIKEQGDTFFTTNAAIESGNWPFGGIPSDGKMVFANGTSFVDGTNAPITRLVSQDYDGDGNTTDAG